MIRAAVRVLDRVLDRFDARLVRASALARLEADLAAKREEQVPTAPPPPTAPELDDDRLARVVGGVGEASWPTCS